MSEKSKPLPEGKTAVGKRVKPGTGTKIQKSRLKAQDVRGMSRADGSTSLVLPSLWQAFVGRRAAHPSFAASAQALAPQSNPASSSVSGEHADVATDGGR